MPGVKVQCIDCAHSTRPKTAAASDDHMLRAGFASCAVRFDPPGRWLAVLWPRYCDKFSLSPDAQKRRLWLNKRTKP